MSEVEYLGEYKARLFGLVTIDCVQVSLEDGVCFDILLKYSENDVQSGATLEYHLSHMTPETFHDYVDDILINRREKVFKFIAWSRRIVE